MIKIYFLQPEIMHGFKIILYTHPGMELGIGLGEYITHTTKKLIFFGDILRQRRFFFSHIVIKDLF